MQKMGQFKKGRKSPVKGEEKRSKVYPFCKFAERAKERKKSRKTKEKKRKKRSLSFYFYFFFMLLFFFFGSRMENDVFFHYFLYLIVHEMPIFFF